MRNSIELKAVLFTIIAGITVIACGSPAETGKLCCDTEGKPVIAILRLTPFQPRSEFSGSLSLTVKAGAEIEAIAYDRHALSITALRRGKAPPHLISNLRATGRMDIWREEKNKLPRPDGDVLELIVEGSIRRFKGSLDQAPSAIRELAEALIQAYAKLPLAAPAAHYAHVAGAPGAAAKTEWAALPAGLRQAVQAVARGEGGFVALDKMAARELEGLGAQVVVAGQAVPRVITLYKTTPP